MIGYHKIQTIWKRDLAAETRKKPIMRGVYSRPEFEFLRNMLWVWTEKVDGMCMTLSWDGEHLLVHGKTERAQIPAPLLQWVAATMMPERLREILPVPCTLYGEGVGPKIQSGGNYGGIQRIVLFDVLTREGFESRDIVGSIARAIGMESVPEVGWGTIDEAEQMVEAGFRSAWGDFPAEGLVIRPACELRCRDGNRVIAKLKTRDYR